MRAPVLTVLGIICLAAAFGWARSARHRHRLVGRIDPEVAPDAYTLAWSTFRKEFHAASLYGLLALASLVNAFVEGAAGAVVFSTVAIPALVSTAWARHAVREARMARQSIDIERRAEEALEQFARLSAALLPLQRVQRQANLQRAVDLLAGRARERLGGAEEPQPLARAEEAAAMAGSAGRALELSLGHPGGRLEGALADALGDAELVVNATSVGMGGSSEMSTIDLPVDPALIGAGSVVVDLIYHPAETALMAAMRVRGIEAYGGLSMLVCQAARAFTLWTGVEAPLLAMHTAAQASLASR